MLSIGAEPNGRVLIVTNERHVAKLIETNLRRQGHAVKCAYRGDEAIECLERQKFDLAAIERNLPDVTGEQVVFWIRSHERTKEMRVVLFGRSVSSDDPPRGPTGVDRFLIKPFNPSEIFS